MPQPLVAANLVQNGVGATGPFVVGPAWLSGGPNPSIPVFDKSIGLIATIVSGGPTYSVQVTGDSVPNSSGNWNEHDVLTNLTQSANSNIQWPVTGIRLVIKGGTGIVNLAMCR